MSPKTKTPPRRHELTDEQWERLKPLLPPQKPATGRPSKDHRTVINGMLWIMRTGAPWEDLPESYGSHKTVSSRFYRWRKAGIWDKILAEVQKDADTKGQVEWELHFVDSSIVRAHQHAAGARRALGAKKGSQIQTTQKP
jgi:transposase